jgi:hypothetical protein
MIQELANERQEALFIATDGLAKSSGHPFYRRLNELLAEAEFDRWIERRCERYYVTQEKGGQTSVPPGVYFRMLLVGYFEDIDSQRGIAWRCADSLSLRQFLGVPLHDATPDHSTLTNTQSIAAGGVPRSVSIRAADCGGQKAVVGQDGGRRQHNAGGQRRDEEHRAARHRRGLEAVCHAAGGGSKKSVTSTDC